MRYARFTEQPESIRLLIVCMCVAMGQLTYGQDERLEHTPNIERRPQSRTVGGGDVDDGIPELGVIVIPSPGRGVLVTEVIVDGPAERASIRPGDYILAVAGAEVSTPADLHQAVRTNLGGQKVQVIVWRAGEETTKRIMLAQRRAFRPPIHAFVWPDATWLVHPLESREMQLEQMIEQLRLQVEELRGQVKMLQGESESEEAGNPGQLGNTRGSAESRVQRSENPRREYFQDYGHYYRFQRVPPRRPRDVFYRRRPLGDYSYYPYVLPPYAYYRYDGRPYYYLTPEGPRFGTRVGPYWFEYWY